MNSERFNFETACRLANIKVSNSEDVLTIRTTFNLLDKSNLGVIIIVLGGLAMGILAIVSTNDIFTLLIGSILGFGVGTIALLSILSQLTNYFKIEKDSIEFRNRLQLTRAQLTKDHRVKMKTQTEFTKLNSQAGSGSYYRVIDIYLTNGKNEKLIIDFQTDEKYSDMTNQLGNEITAMVKSKIKSL